MRMQIPLPVYDALYERELLGNPRKNYLISQWLREATSTHEARVAALKAASKRLHHWAVQQARQEVRG